MDEIIKCPHCGVEDEHHRALVEEMDYDISTVIANVRYKCIVCCKNFFVKEYFKFEKIGRISK